jgi:hypothetical protein
VPIRNKKTYLSNNIAFSPPIHLPIITMTSPAKQKPNKAFHVNVIFAPKKKVLVQIGKVNLFVYPDVTPDMGNNERSLSFSINKTALANARAISYNQKLNHISQLWGCSNLVDIERNVFKNAAFHYINLNNHLTVISYHNAQGAIINDALDAAANLKTVQDGPQNACRPNAIYFAKVRPKST